MTRRSIARRLFLPHLTAYLVATLGGIAVTFTIRPDLGFPVFAGLLAWGLGMALHGWAVIMPAPGGDVGDGEGGGPR